jgi:hypothetical protein
MKPNSTVVVIGQQRYGTVIATFGGNAHVRFDYLTESGLLHGYEWHPFQQLREVKGNEV